MRIGFILLDGYALMSTAAAVEPLRAANLLAGQTLYDLRFLSVDSRLARASAGALFETAPLSEAGADFDVVFVVAGGNPFAVRQPALLPYLRRLDVRRVRLGGISGGAAILALGGLMEGRRFTIHWEHMEALREMSDRFLLERSLFVIDRDRLTCAGGVAPLDMMHALITADHGMALAREVSDWFIHTRIRPSQDPQRAGFGEKYNVHHPSLLAAIELMDSHIADPLGLEQLAALSGLGLRQFQRLFKNRLGKTVMAFYRDLRLAKAEELLRQSPLSILEVGLASGFPNPATLPDASVPAMASVQATCGDRGSQGGPPLLPGRSNETVWRSRIGRAFDSLMAKYAGALSFGAGQATQGGRPETAVPFGRGV